MVKATLYIDLEDPKKKEFGRAEMDLELPFTPFEGLDIEPPDSDEREVKGVTWQHREQRFLLWMGTEEMSPENFKQMYTEQGWKVSGSMVSAAER